jgi:hypothetical protein
MNLENMKVTITELIMKKIHRIGRYKATGIARWLAPASIMLVLSACGPFGISIDLVDLDLNSTQATPIPDGISIEAPTDEPEISQDVTPVFVQEPDTPDLVWMPFSHGLEESGNILSVRPEQVGFETSPVDIRLYWDYSGATGKLSFASEFWHAARGSNRSVSDLMVYDYVTGESEQWLPDNVARASWSPLHAGRFSEQRLAAAIYNTEEGYFDLAIVNGPGQVEWLANCATPNFSWSPDGTHLAYNAFDYNEPGDTPDECEGVFLVSIEDQIVTRIAEDLPTSGGWIGDRPLWAQGEDVLLLSGATPETLFWVIPLDGSGAFQIDETGSAESVGETYLPRPQHQFWSSEHRSLIGQTEGMLDPWGVWVYSFSEDMHTIEDAYRVNWGEYGHDLILVDWWEAGESVLLRDISNTSALNPFGVAMVWSLSDRYAFELSFSRPIIEVPLYPQEVRTGVEEIDQIIDYFLVRKFDWRSDLIRTLTTECTLTEYSVGPPLCGDGQAEGTRVEVFPYRKYRATEYATLEELTDFLEFPLGGLFAVYKVPEDSYSDQRWPRGEYSLVFASIDGDLAVELIVEAGDVVRIEFSPLTPVEVLDGAEYEYLLPPLTE